MSSSPLRGQASQMSKDQGWAFRGKKPGWAEETGCQQGARGYEEKVWGCECTGSQGDWVWPQEGLSWCCGQWCPLSVSSRDNRAH